MIITNATVITWDQDAPLHYGKDVYISAEKIVEIGDHEKINQKYPQETVIDASGKVLMPGLICAHTHFYGLFSRGLAIPGESPRNFTEILKKLWWPLDSSLTEGDVRYCTLVCLIDAIKHGTTTLFDHHASPLCINGSLDIISDTFQETGVRGAVSYEVTDRYGEDKRDASINENIRMILKVKEPNYAKGLVKALMGIHAGLTVSDQTLEKVREKLPSGSGIHIHVAEDKVDEEDSITKSGLRVVDRLNKYSLINSNSLIVHGVHLDKKEMEIVRDSSAWLTHQPRSNMNNAVGMAEIEMMDELGIKICMGNDGFSNAMWDEWRTCYLSHKMSKRSPSAMNGNLVAKIGALNNADLVTHIFDGLKIGKIAPGYQADLILVDYYPITEMNQFNIPWHILFGFRESMVTDTMVNGKWLMRDRELVDLDEQEISRKALELSKNVWKRYSEKF